MQNQFKERFRKLNPLELVQTFNKDLGHSGWVGSRGEFLVALREEFGNRNICIDNITHSGAIRSRGFIMKKESEAVYVAKKVIPKKGPQKAATDHHSIGFRIRTARVHLPQSQAGINQ